MTPAEREAFDEALKDAHEGLLANIRDLGALLADIRDNHPEVWRTYCELQAAKRHE